MTREELIHKLFGEPQEKKIYLYSQEIEEALSKKTDKLTIDVREIDLEDPSKKRQAPTYLDDELLKFTETGISILYATDKTTEMLKQYIPRTVKELTIPSTFLEDLSFLQEFPNLETLHISDYSTFPKEVLEFIEQNTTITRMTFRSSTTLNHVKGEPGFNVIEAGNTIGRYGKLTMSNKGPTGEWKSAMQIYTSSYDNNNLEVLAGLYETISPYLPPLKSASMYKNKEDLYSPEFDFRISKGEVKKLITKKTSPTEVSKVYKKALEKTKIIETLYILDNQTYDDIYQLKQVAETSELSIVYNDKNDFSSAPYDEFLNMRATIDHYKELLETSNLSPVEKVAYVYDILKTMRYRENITDRMRPRNIHSIVTDGDIVCVGYASFANQLLSEVGIKSIKVGVTCTTADGEFVGHARNFIRVDDDKYNIHGLYAMDITWDSDQDIAIIEENGKKTVVARPDDEMKEQIFDKYDSLILYRHFLIPMETYELRYPDELNPSIYEAYKKGKAKELTIESKKIASGEMRRSEAKDVHVLNQHEELFDRDEGYLTVERYFNSPKPSLETFEQILSTVRQAQGYTSEEAKHEVDRVVELHQMLNDQNPDSPNHFFKTSAK